MMLARLVTHYAPLPVDEDQLYRLQHLVTLRATSPLGGCLHTSAIPRTYLGTLPDSSVLFMGGID